MAMDDLLKGFLEYGSTGLMAAAIIYVVRYMLDKQREIAKEERDSHEHEVDKLTATFSAAIQSVGASMEKTADKIVDEMRREKGESK
jgi:hypothetical protein